MEHFPLYPKAANNKVIELITKDAVTKMVPISATLTWPEWNQQQLQAAKKKPLEHNEIYFETKGEKITRYTFKKVRDIENW